jgi:2-oxoacid:acceptor oxidoreductase gamma subunit (pyruvate/2-ketoisovalerate family)
MIRIRIHGRGGQGGKTAAELLAMVIFSEGKYPFAQAAPAFGPERRGAPVNAFVRVSDSEIRERGAISDPDMVIVLDETLAKTMNVAEGLHENGIILINSKREPFAFAEYAQHFTVGTIDADAIAARFGLGTKRAPIVNTAILGAFLRISGLGLLDTLLAFIEDEMPKKTAENKQAAAQAFISVHINREE